MFRFVSLFLMACAVAWPAAAQSDFQRHALTVPMVEKYQAASAELKKTIKRKDEDDDDDDAAKDGKSVDDIVKELDATPGVKPVLARHGFTSRTYALTTLALFQAGFYVAMEPSMDKKKASSLLASYPPETRANIELLRKNPKLLKN